jgi:hypothetical protein
VASHGVLRSVNYTKYIEVFATVLAAVAAIVTPLGLHESIVPESKATMQSFHYIDDNGLFGLGLGTMPRNNSLGWSRICGAFGPSACPNSDNTIETFTNATGDYSHMDGPYNTTVPQRTIDLFQSGVDRMGSTVSGPFDIQWRSLSWSLIADTLPYNYSNANNAPSYAVGQFRIVSSMVLDNKTEVVEGLVVDTVNGGVGFRNHTAPPLTTYGSSWTEDLLFIEPVTQCVDTNLTFDYEIPTKKSDLVVSLSASNVLNLRLVDHGGFVNLNHTYPYWDRTDTQANPDLWQRAYKGAWLNNAYSMAFMNVTNLHNSSNPDSPKAFRFLDSYMGKEFLFKYANGRSAGTSVPFSPQQMSVMVRYGYYLDSLDMPLVNQTFINGTANPDADAPPVFSNPWNVTWEEWSDIGESCSTREPFSR